MKDGLKIKRLEIKRLEIKRLKMDQSLPRVVPPQADLTRGLKTRDKETKDGR